MEAFQCANTLTTHALEEIVLWRCQMPMLHYHRSQHMANKLATYILLRCGCEVFLFTSLSEIRRLSDVSLSYENTAAMDAIDRFTRLCVVVGEPDGAWRLEGWQRTQIHHHRHMALFIRFQFGCLLFFGKTKVKLAFATHFRCTHAECIKRW